MRKTYKWLGVILILTLVLVAVMFRLAGVSPAERDATVELSGLPPGTPPLRIVLLADFHIARFGDTRERLRQTVSRVSALDPDVILLAGDFLADPILQPGPMRPNIAPLADLKARLGIFAILGNHDYNRAADRVTLWLTRAGVRVLDNEAARAGPLAIVGISDEFTHHARLGPAMRAAKDAGGVPIVFTHSPDIIPALPSNVELALAGHTHCGQVVLPLIGPLDTRSRFGRRYACGVIREGRRITIVTSGLGVSRLPLRLGAPPDFWVITIVPPRARS